MMLTALKTLFTPDVRLSKLLLWIFIAWLLLAVNIALSFLPLKVIPMKGNLDKLYHCAGYFALMFWWLQLYPSKAARYLLALVFILLSGCIEILQSFHPLRHMDWWDFAANSVGVILAIVLGLLGLDQLLLRLERRIWA